MPEALQNEFLDKLAALAKEVRLVRCKAGDGAFPLEIAGKRVGSFLVLSESLGLKLVRVWDPSYSVIARVKLASFYVQGNYHWLQPFLLPPTWSNLNF
jgi:hypothetical protein